MAQSVDGHRGLLGSALVMVSGSGDQPRVPRTTQLRGCLGFFPSLSPSPSAPPPAHSFLLTRVCALSLKQINKSIF